MTCVVCGTNADAVGPGWTNVGIGQHGRFLINGYACSPEHVPEAARLLLEEALRLERKHLVTS